MCATPLFIYKILILQLFLLEFVMAGACREITNLAKYGKISYNFVVLIS